MNEQVKKLIVDYKELIKENNFAILYDNIMILEYPPEIIGEFTQTLLSAGINPLIDGNLLNVPDYYLSCLPIKTFKIPSNIIRLGEGCFAYCEKLENVIIPTNVKHIRSYAFAECGLKELYIPSTVTKIDQNAFFGTNITITCEHDSAADKYCQFYDVEVQYV